MEEIFEGEDNIRYLWSMEESIRSVKEDVLLKCWVTLTVASCLCAVLVDPLFLYIPIIKDDIKCLDFDQKLKIAALILRSFTDLFFILNIVLRIYEFLEDSCFFSLDFGFIERFCGRMIIHGPMRRSIGFLIDSLAVVPLPQVREVPSPHVGVNWFPNLYLFTCRTG